MTDRVQQNPVGESIAPAKLNRHDMVVVPTFFSNVDFLLTVSAAPILSSP